MHTCGKFRRIVCIFGRQWCCLNGLENTENRPNNVFKWWQRRENTWNPTYCSLMILYYCVFAFVKSKGESVITFFCCHGKWCLRDPNFLSSLFFIGRTNTSFSFFFWLLLMTKRKNKSKKLDPTLRKTSVFALFRFSLIVCKMIVS